MCKMKIYTFALQKGGTGKTSVSVSVAVELANAGKKVLLVDADPQGNATTWIYSNQFNNELAGVLLDTCTIQDAIKQTSVNNLYILPTAGINGKLKEYADNTAGGKLAKIKNILRGVSTDFDYCIIDTSPSFGNFEQSIFYATNEIITVLQLDNFSKDGIQIFINRLQSFIKDLDPDAQKPVFNKIVLNAKNESYKLQSEYFEQFKGLISNGFNIYTMPQDQAFKTAQASYKTVQEVTKKPDTIQSIKDIASDILGGN